MEPIRPIFKRDKLACSFKHDSAKRGTGNGKLSRGRTHLRAPKRMTKATQKKYPVHPDDQISHTFDYWHPPNCILHKKRQCPQRDACAIIRSDKNMCSINTQRSRGNIKYPHARKAPQHIRLFTSSVPAAKFAFQSSFCSLFLRGFSHIPLEGGSLRNAQLQIPEKCHASGSCHSLTSEDLRPTLTLSNTRRVT